MYHLSENAAEGRRWQLHRGRKGLLLPCSGWRVLGIDGVTLEERLAALVGHRSLGKILRDRSSIVASSTVETMVGSPYRRSLDRCTQYESI
jgi:hypothetical protein